MTFDDEMLYACGDEGGGVAGHVTYAPIEKTISWFMPGGRQRKYVIARVIDDDGQVFRFEDKAGRKFTLFALTHAYYNQHVRRDGEPNYSTDTAMRAAYEHSLG